MSDFSHQLAAVLFIGIKSSFFLQAHYLDPTRHYLRLKFLMESQVKIYIPKPDEDVCDLVGCSLYQLNNSGFYLSNKRRKHT